MRATTQRPVWQTQLLLAWQKRGTLAWLLWPLSLVYRTLAGLRRMTYRSGWLTTQALPVPVIVVGNVIAGGAGKTPIVIELARHLQQRGLHVGVISRGYGRTTPGCRAVTVAASAQDVGDEPALIHRRTGAPVFVGERRIEAAHALLLAHPDTQIIVSDDGLQHLVLPRDLEVVVFDDRGLGNGFLLPAGPLREPWPRHAGAGLVLHTGQHPQLGGFTLTRRLADHALRADGSTVPLADVAASATLPVLALAAIARPEAFFAMLRAQGVQPTQLLALPDHFDFSSLQPSQYKGYRLICTEKDAVKLWPLCPDALAVPLICDLPDAFWQAFDLRLEHRFEPLSLPHGHTTT